MRKILVIGTGPILASKEVLSAIKQLEIDCEVVNQIPKLPEQTKEDMALIFKEVKHEDVFVPQKIHPKHQLNNKYKKNTKNEKTKTNNDTGSRRRF